MTTHVEAKTVAVYKYVVTMTESEARLLQNFLGKAFKAADGEFVVGLFTELTDTLRRNTNG